MTKNISFNALLENSITNYWDQDALTDYLGITLQYHDVARKIEKLHILFSEADIKKQDKIALCGRNSAHWATVLFAILTYGAVAVPIQHEFTAEQIHNIVNHSEARILFADNYVSKAINHEEMPQLDGIISINDFGLILGRTKKLYYAREHLNELFGKKFPKAFRAQHVQYHKDAPEELALINYTSGTTGHSKGVMLPYRSLWSNTEYCLKAIGSHIEHGSSTVNILPMAHMYGMAVELFFPFCYGCHLHFLTRLPSPAVITQAFADIKPAIVVSVPLIVEKIVKKNIFPFVQNSRIKLLLSMPVVNKKVRQKICDQVKQIFGGNAYEVIVGGAPLNKEVELFLKSIEFPLTMVYGATECGPIVTFTDYCNFVPGSCGLPADRMEIKIDSKEPSTTPGEILTRGDNVMLGYYKQDSATKESIDSDGWFHTGDLATQSEDGYVFIHGRIKNILLGANGQNVFPEEIEDKLNSMTLVAESVVTQSENNIIALVHPDEDEAKNMGLTDEDISQIMEQNRKELNTMLPSFSRVKEIRLYKEEFAKTPKKNIKRYLYRNISKIPFFC